MSISLRQAQEAFAVLEAYGRQGFSDPTSPSVGQAIGHAVYACFTPETCNQIAREALEGWNAHLAVAALDAIDKGRHGQGHRGNPPFGSVTCEGRDLKIRLPKEWA